MTTSIQTDHDSIVVHAVGPATGNVWLVIGGQDFPAHRWNDFIVVILGWWAVALLRLLRKASERELIHFMDGPYAVEVSSLPGGLLRFRALEGAHRNRERAVGEQSAMKFAAELRSRSHEVLNSCRKHKWWSPDADQLHTSIYELEEFARVMTVPQPHQ